MKSTKGSDPWESKKHEIDPWNSPWRKKREDALVHGQRPDADCAFGEETHHAPAFRRSKLPLAASRQAPNTRSLTPQLIPFIICAALFVIVLMVSFVQTMFLELPYYGSVSMAFAIWLTQAVPTLIVLGALTLFFLVRLKNAAK